MCQYLDLPCSGLIWIVSFNTVWWNLSLHGLALALMLGQVIVFFVLADSYGHVRGSGDVVHFVVHDHDGVIVRSGPW